MEELLNAAKELLTHRVSYYDRNPEVKSVILSANDKKYAKAWERLEQAVEIVEVGEINPL